MKPNLVSWSAAVNRLVVEARVWGAEKTSRGDGPKVVLG